MNLILLILAQAPVKNETFPYSMRIKINSLQLSEVCEGNACIPLYSEISELLPGHCLGPQSQEQVTQDWLQLNQQIHSWENGFHTQTYQIPIKVSL